jgi:hypothetical protein
MFGPVSLLVWNLSSAGAGSIGQDHSRAGTLECVGAYSCSLAIAQYVAQARQAPRRIRNRGIANICCFV